MALRRHVPVFWVGTHSRVDAPTGNMEDEAAGLLATEVYMAMAFSCPTSGQQRGPSRPREPRRWELGAPYRAGGSPVHSRDIWKKPKCFHHSRQPR